MGTLLVGLALAVEPVLITAERVVDASWPGEHDPDALRLAALEGMVEHLNARESVPVNRVLVGDEVGHPGPRGVGLQYLLVPGQGLVVTEVVPDSAAANAGLLAGDIVTELAGFDTRAAEGPEELVAIEGGAVELVVRRTGGHEAAYLLVPGPLPSYSVATAATHVVLTVRQPVEGLADTVGELRTSHADKSLVLDLRGARGGTVLGAVGLADQLLPRGASIGLERRQGSEHALASAREGWDTPLAVLVDGDTAGPAELVAAALQHHARATVVGTPSAGLAASTSVRFLDEGFALELVDARLRDPTGASWDGTGVQPDVRIQPVLEAPADGAVPRDVQLEGALHALGLGSPR